MTSELVAPDARVPVVGIFVGGNGSRLGGVEKSLLRRRDGQRVLDALRREAEAALPGVPVVLVGRREAYAGAGLSVIDDDPPNIGPLGGLSALLRRGAAEGRSVIALGGDMPFVSAALLERLASAEPMADAHAPRPDGIWQPLCAWYRPEPTLLAVNRVLERGRRSLSAVLDELGERARVVPLTEAELSQLRDWDTPEDVKRDGGSI